MLWRNKLSLETICLHPVFVSKVSYLFPDLTVLFISFLFFRFNLLNSLQRLYSLYKNLELHNIILLLGRSYRAYQYFNVQSFSYFEMSDNRIWCLALLLEPKALVIIK